MPGQPSLTRRRLLQAGAHASAAALLGGRSAAVAKEKTGYGQSDEPGVWQNWSGGQKSRPASYLAPGSEEELVRLLQKAPAPVRPVGASHSFSPVVSSEGTIVSLDGIKGLIRHDAAKQQATLWAGTRVRDAGEPLAAVGQGLPNQGDVDPQSLAGAIGTSTHGTGITLGSFSSMVRGVRLVTAKGDVVECGVGKDEDVLHAAGTNVGVLGVVTQITLQNREAYSLRERQYSAPLAELWPNLEKLRDAHRHFEFWAAYKADLALVKILDETNDAPTPPPAFEPPVDTAVWLACEIAHNFPSWDGTMQRWLMKLVSASDRVDRSYRIFPSPRSVRFNEMEYEMPAANGPECAREVLETVKKSDLDTLFPIEYRYVAADECWLSPFYRQPTCSISVHQYHKVDYRPLFRLVEPILRKHGGRPHWGKLHTLSARALAPLYPKWDEFQAVRRHLDPEGRMLSPYLRRLFEEGAAA